MPQPLNHDDIEFHNAGALEPLNGLGGVVPVRVPASVRKDLGPRARFIAADSVGTELRFVTAAPNFRATFQAHDNDVLLDVYRGGFCMSSHVIPAGQVRVLNLVEPEAFRFVTDEALNAGAFSSNVWRIIMGRHVCSFLGLDTFGERLRPPQPDEKPALRWLAYGSSITHSTALGYPAQAARRLCVDVLNKGMSGSCACEGALADYFADEEEWDFATAELGINMRAHFTPEEFESRARYFLQRIHEARPTAPIVLITHYMNRQHFASSEDNNPVAVERQMAYDHILRTIAREYTSENFHLIEGRKILPDFDGLTADLIHPGFFGNMQIGENLAAKLKPIIEPLGSTVD